MYIYTFLFIFLIDDLHTRLQCHATQIYMLVAGRGVSHSHCSVLCKSSWYIRFKYYDQQMHVCELCVSHVNSIPTSFKHFRCHHRGSSQDYKESKQIVKMHK